MDRRKVTISSAVQKTSYYGVARIEKKKTSSLSAGHNKQDYNICS